MAIGRQLPVYSPLPVSALWAAIAGGDARPALASALRDDLGAADVVLTSSGTVALTLALLAARARRPGAPVVLPGYACYDLVTAAVGAGVPVRLYDLDPATLAPDAASLERALAGGAAALVVVHLFGVPVPMDLMRSAADRAGALLVEDAAQATGGSWGDRPLGAHGDLGVLSFGRGKGETGGGGGALLSRAGVHLPDDLRARLAEPAGSALPFTVKLAAQWLLGRPSVYGIPASIPMLRLGETIYKSPPPLERMAPASARVLATTRPASRGEAETRRANAAAFRAALGAAASTRSVRPAGGGEPGWLRFPLRGPVPASLAAEAVALGLAAAYPLPLRELPALASLLDAGTGSTPGAVELARELRTLPVHRHVDGAARARTVEWLTRLAAAR